MTKLTTTEQTAIISLSSIMSLRMIGLFMTLPILAAYLKELTHSTPFLIGLAIGIYGLTQATFQLPLGILSDYYGRKPIISIGLCLFAIGSLLTACAHSIGFIIFGRAIQGTGAIGSSLLALLSDLTPEAQRTKAMAMTGMIIGLSFFIAMFIGPWLAQWYGVNSLFYLASLFALGGLSILFTFVPTPTTYTQQRSTTIKLSSCLTLLMDPNLSKLNASIFILHAILTASFLKTSLSTLLMTAHAGLLAILLVSALILSLLTIGIAEKRKQIKHYFVLSIVILGLAESLLWAAHDSLISLAVGILLFFASFAVLEAFLPSLISRTAPAHLKGSALGLYSCSQFLGIFTGGALGGWINACFPIVGLPLFCLTLTIGWFILACFMQNFVKNGLQS